MRNQERNIDKKDAKILNILLNDSRTPTTQIARSVGISHDAVKYRIKNLREAGIIKSFTVVLDLAKVGLPVWGDVVFSLWNLKKERYEEWIRYLEHHPYIAAIWNLSGRYEWFVEVYAESLEKFNDIVGETKMKFSDIIKDSETLFVLRELKAKQFLPPTFERLSEVEKVLGKRSASRK